MSVRARVVSVRARVASVLARVVSMHARVVSVRARVVSVRASDVHRFEHVSRRFFLHPFKWNDQLDSLRLIDSLELFKSSLKTHLFMAAFVNYL